MMEKTTAGLIGALAGLATMGTAQAATQAPASSTDHVMRIASYADLLKPIPNAAEIMRAQQAKSPVQTVQYYDDQPPPHHHHHHHHHHHYYPPPPPPHHHHHHHHQHQSGLTVVIPGLGVVRN